MKRSAQALFLETLLVAAVRAQAAGDDGAVTSYIPVCPTATSTTITLPTTVTFCPGPHCAGGGPQITGAPGSGVGQPGTHLGEYTSIGPDGKQTVLGIWETVYDSVCPTGIVPATYTITAPCPCENTPHPTVMPTGFETAVVPCSACAATGGPTAVTVTQPCPTGPYASQIPSTGGSGASANAGAGANAGAAAGPANNGGSGAGANAAASANAAANAGSNGNGASAVAAASAAAQAGTGSGAAAPAAAPAPGVVNAVPAPLGGKNGTMMNNNTAPYSPVKPYMSSADRASFVGASLVAGLLACAAFVL